MDDLERMLDDGKEYMGINLEKVTQDSKIPSTIRALAMDLMRCPYLSVGDFLKNLSDSEVYGLQELVEEETFESMENLLLLTIMLAKAEAADGPWEDKALIAEQLTKMQMLITVASLHRKGMIQVWYENFSLGKDMEDKQIASKL
jgi:hypothetical protein